MPKSLGSKGLDQPQSALSVHDTCFCACLSSRIKLYRLIEGRASLYIPVLEEAKKNFDPNLCWNTGIVHVLAVSLYSLESSPKSRKMVEVFHHYLTQPLPEGILGIVPATDATTESLHPEGPKL